MRRAVVTGASGLLGGAIVRRLTADGVAADGWSHTVASAPDGVRFRRLDLLEPDAPEQALAAARPDLVMHCAALTDVDACEAAPLAAEALNATVPGRLAAAARALGAAFVHVSTDAVYDGEQAGAHSEDDPPRPANAYARSKLAGETAAVEAHPDALVVRTTMHGWTAQGRPSFSEGILRGLLRGQRLTLFDDVRFSVLNVADLAGLIVRLAECGAAGVVNAGAVDAVTKATFGRMIAREFGLAEDPIVPISLADAGLRAPRPRNTALAVERLTGLLGAPPPTIADGLRRLRDDVPAAARLKGRAGTGSLLELMGP